jgi:hypothetical protein
MVTTQQEVPVRNTIGFITMAMAVVASPQIAAQAGQGAPAQVTPVVRITVSGCVEASDQSAVDDKKIDTKYTLTDAKSRTNSKSGQGGQTSGTGSQAGSQSSSTYRLNGSSAATLEPEVGHQVEIVAIVEDPGTPTPVGTSGSSESTAKAPKLKVEQIKVIAPTCPPK